MSITRLLSKREAKKHSKKLDNIINSQQELLTFLKSIIYKPEETVVELNPAEVMAEAQPLEAKLDKLYKEAYTTHISDLVNVTDQVKVKVVKNSDKKT